MTLEDAIRIYRECDVEEANCGNCPLHENTRLDVGLFATIETNPCSLISGLGSLIEEVPVAAP